MQEPVQAKENYFNLWRGWQIDEKKQKSCKFFLEHIKENISSNNIEIYEYILNWMADAIQNPAEKPGVGIVLMGDQGTGKGVFTNLFGKLFGQHFMAITQPKQLTGNFNWHLKDKLLLFADELNFKDANYRHGIMKALITEKKFTVEKKFGDAFQANNYIRIIIASNAEHVLKIAKNERRFFIVRVLPKRIKDRVYFRKIVDEMENGGIEALYYFLKKRDISKVDVGCFPSTDELYEQKILSLEPIEEFMYSVIENGSFDGTGKWQKEILTDELQELFKVFSLKNSITIKGKSSETKLGQYLKRLEFKKERKRINGKRRSVYKIPTLEKCKKLFGL